MENEIEQLEKERTEWLIESLVKCCESLVKENEETKLYDLIEDISIKFANWQLKCELKEDYEGAEPFMINDKELFQYFIKNIYHGKED